MERYIAFALTNPESEYGGTRHNIGHQVLTALANRLDARFTSHKTPNQVANAQTRIGASGVPLTLAIPHGYMNLHGNGAQTLLAYTKVDPAHLIVVHDDMDFPTGTLRLKRGGTGGHNGLKSIKQRLKSDDYIRLRFGIGRPPGRMDPAKYVLNRFTKSEQDIIGPAVEEAVDTIILIAEQGFEQAQQQLHTRS